MVLCTSCDGFGKHYSRPIYRKGEVKIIELPCELCKGTGKIKDKQIEWILQGTKLKTYRLWDKGLTLREAAKALNIDPSNLSKMERGIIKPRNIWKQYGEKTRL